MCCVAVNFMLILPVRLLLLLELLRDVLLILLLVQEVQEGARVYSKLWQSLQGGIEHNMISNRCIC